VIENHSQQAVDPGLAMTAAGWAGDSSRRWLDHADILEAQLAPVHVPLLAACGDLSGRRVLEVGCGRGATTHELAAGVGPSGHVTAVDISETLAAATAARCAPTFGGRVDVRCGDAQHLDLAPDAVDLVVSRFGVMFFDDPIAAFANLATTTRPGGRLVAAVWQRRDRSPVQSVGLDVAVRAAAALGTDLDLGDPAAGPFSLGVPEIATATLTAAGWTNIRLEPHLVPMALAGPGARPDDAVELAFNIGPLRALVADAPPEAEAAVRSALLDAYTALHDGTGMWLDGAIVIVQAERSNALQRAT